MKFLNNRHIKIPLLTLACVTASCLLVSQGYAQSQQDWHFDCFPEKRNRIADIPNPNMLINVDVSGSMRSSAYAGGPSRMNVAKAALSSLIDANDADPRLNYGLSTFSSSSDHEVTCGPNNSSLLRKKITRMYPGGGTRTDLALEDGLQTSCHTQLQPNQISATLLITDGEPAFPSRTIEKACAHREKASIFVIGLGKTTNTEFNNIMAAAGGTGQCTMGDPCDPDNLRKFDEGRYRFNPYLTNFMDSCTGSYSASRTGELLNAMAQISDQVACNFPLETIPGAPKVIPVDPSGNYPWIKITPRTNHFAAQPIPYIQKATTPGWYWQFANDSRNSVNLGKKACKAMRFGNYRGESYNVVGTHVGCICEQEVGTTCHNTDYQATGLCPEGTWTCDRGYDICRSIDYPNGNTTETNKEYSCVVFNAKSHCAIGKGNSCTNGRFDCKSVSGPMPEVCNGLDDDCDGVTDNMSSSWASSRFTTHLENFKSYGQNQKPYNKLHAQACNSRDACACEGERPALGSMPEGFFTPASLPDYTDDWDNRHGSCVCQAN